MQIAGFKEFLSKGNGGVIGIGKRERGTAKKPEFDGVVSKEFQGTTGGGGKT
jgi:hypothetical protein